MTCALHRLTLVVVGCLTLHSFCLFHFTIAQQLENPISIPIIRGELNVHTAPFVQIPKVNNETAKILGIVPQRQDLYVTTQQGLIFKVDKRRQVILWFDVGRALLQAGSQGFSVGTAQGGLRGVAFPPSFEKTGYFYTSQVEKLATNMSDHHFLPFVHPFSDRTNRESVVSEWRYDWITNIISPSSHRELFRINQRRVAHAIQQMAFKGSRLFIAHGDSSRQPAATGGGQNPDGLGKILSIRPRGPNGTRPRPLPYEIPGSNPFLKIRNSPALGDRQQMIPEVWALGFRNPHNLCFSKNGTLFVADIGRRNVEEVNIVKRGLNYGWPQREGTFVHFMNDTGALIIDGIAPLPRNDSNEENRMFEYPVAQFGHDDVRGNNFILQAIAGACPVENGSPVSGNYFYADFAVSGRLFYSHLDEMFNARTNGKPKQLTQARTREANIFFDHANNPHSRTIRVQTLRDIVAMDPDVIAMVPPEKLSKVRVDVRFGQGANGELYWSSKTNGKIYVITSSVVGGPGGPVPK